MLADGLGVVIPALHVGDRVLYEGKTWRVNSLGRHAYHREGDQMIANGELHAVLLLEADPPGSRAPFKTGVPESRWDEAQFLEKRLGVSQARSAVARSMVAGGGLQSQPRQPSGA
jgi:hypothetical protein